MEEAEENAKKYEANGRSNNEKSKEKTVEIEKAVSGRSILIQFQPDPRGYLSHCLCNKPPCYLIKSQTTSKEDPEF